MKSKQSLFLMILGVALVGCATISTSTDYDPTANFSGLKTYDWEGPQPITGNPRLDNDILHSRIRNAVERELAVKGFQKVSGAEPNFKVAYHVGLEEKLDVTTFHYYDYGYPDYYSARRGFAAAPRTAWPQSETRVYQYEEGTLLLDIVDPMTKKMIWRGTAKAEVNPNESPEKKEAKINNSVHKLLAKFPPQS